MKLNSASFLRGLAAVEALFFVDSRGNKKQGNLKINGFSTETITHFYWKEHL
jgi:hypothetical protein